MEKGLLIIDDEEVLCRALKKFFVAAGFDVETTKNPEEGLEIFARDPTRVVLVDLMLPGRDGIGVVKRLQEISTDAVAIVMTGFGTIPTAVEAMRSGAYSYLTKPFELDDIAALVNRAMEQRQLRLENRRLKQELKKKYSFENMIGQSRPIREVFTMIEKVAPTDSTVLITGESGTGKELIARALHYNSRRADGPFVVVNCGAIPEELLETELFGHVRGAFTGAVATKPGRFDMANHGTIFLDEIGEMTLKLQVKILRVLQERKYEPVGSGKTHETDVRVLAATNKDLEKAVASGQFREDLFWRLNVIPIHVPTLRSRRDDIPLLIQHFLEKTAAHNKHGPVEISEEATKRMLVHDWPGNIRELENAVERMVVMKRGGKIGLEDLPAAVVGQTATGRLAHRVEIPEGGLSFKDTVAHFETELINKALEKSAGNRNKAAALLGLNRTTLVEKMKKIGIH